MTDITAIDDKGEFVFSLIHINKTVFYNDNGTLASMTAGPDVRGNTYVQTYGYTNGALSFLSSWVKQ